MVGDTWKDAGAAKNAKVKFILLNRNYNLDCDSLIKINSLEETINYIERY